ncbi:hypothetical protein V8Q34_14690 [Blautia sp. JLR.GB0024]
MKYDHTVKYKGKYYPAGADVPVQGNKPLVKKAAVGNSEKPVRARKE